MGELIEAAGKLSEPITKLIEVVAQAVGACYRPTGIRRVARAEADALRIRTTAEVEAMDIQSRAVARLDYVHALQQENVEKITEIAASQLPEKVSSDPVAKDWILQFFNCAQNTTDEDMRVLWGKILAGEVSSPGTYGRRTLQFLSTMEKIEAEKFSQLCHLMFSAKKDGSPGYLFVEEPTSKAIAELMGAGDFTNHFSSIGLLTPSVSTWNLPDMAEKSVFYFGQEYVCTGPAKRKEGSAYRGFETWCHYWSLSSIGYELARIAGAEPLSGYVDRLSEGMGKKLGVRLVKKSEIDRL